MNTYKQTTNFEKWTLNYRNFYLLLILVFSFSCKKDYEVVTPTVPFNHEVTFNYEYDITGLNDTMNGNLLTADIVLYHSDHLSMTWNALKAEFKTADAAFRAVGVQLNLKKAVNVSFPAAWNNQICMELAALPDSGQVPGFYDMYYTTQPKITATMQTAFTDFTYDEANKNRTIFVLPMSGLGIVFAQKNTNGTWQLSNPVPTGAMSFPTYLFHDRIPKNLRGVINMEQSSGVTLAHELGHKLINVSHEGLNVPPAFSGNTIPGLLGYGNSTTIYGGQAGRWHQERLFLSPFLYKMNNGVKVWNPDYAVNGAYDDPIYGSFVMPQ